MELTCAPLEEIMQDSLLLDEEPAKLSFTTFCLSLKT